MSSVPIKKAPRRRPRKPESKTAAEIAAPIYIDTSALAKWYLPERFSEEVESFVQAHAPLAISGLTITEMRCLLARRRRAREISIEDELRAWATFDQDVRNGHLTRHELVDPLADAAVNLIALLPDHPLRSLDALHLAVARHLQAKTLATADRIMGEAASALGLSVVRFYVAKPKSGS